MVSHFMLGGFIPRIRRVFGSIAVISKIRLDLLQRSRRGGAGSTLILRRSGCFLLHPKSRSFQPLRVLLGLIGGLGKRKMVCQKTPKLQMVGITLPMNGRSPVPVQVGGGAALVQMVLVHPLTLILWIPWWRCSRILTCQSCLTNGSPSVAFRGDAPSMHSSTRS